MKYVSIDIETTGLDEEKHQILEIGAIIEDTNNIKPFSSIPKYSAIIEHQSYTGSPYAISLNKRIFDILAEYESLKMKGGDHQAFQRKHNILQESEVVYDLNRFLNKHLNGTTLVDKIQFTAAGKNFGSFDLKFLKKLEHWDMLMKLEHRFIDPAVLYLKFLTDEKLPSTTEALKRAHLKPNVSHEALDDAWQVIQLLRNKYI